MSRCQVLIKCYSRNATSLTYSVCMTQHTVVSWRVSKCNQVRYGVSGDPLLSPVTELGGCSGLLGGIAAPRLLTR